MSSACSQALGLPEIVASILEQLHCKPSLFAALRVNRLWAHEATMVLWRVKPPIHSLIKISNVERRQYYANMISSLEAYEPVVGNLDHQLNACFPRLTELSTLSLHEGDRQALYQFLQPSLRSLRLIEMQPRLKLLLQIATRCPGLLKLSLTWSRHPFPLCDLVWFLDLMPSLTNILLHYGTLDLIPSLNHIPLDDGTDAKLHLHLASRSSLQELYMLGPALREDAAMKILATVTNPYSELRRLSWGAEDKAFRCLARHLSNLNVLKLTLVDTSDDILCAISDCANLASLHVCFMGDSYVPAKGLLAVARKCSHLRVFILQKTSSTDGGSITDDIIRQVATYLPTMTCFRLGIKTSLTIKSLIYLGDRCTKLRECELNGDFDLEQLCRPNLAPLSPQLKLLELSKVSDNIPYERAMSILLQKYPQRTVYLPLQSSSEDWDHRPGPEDWDQSMYVECPWYSSVVHHYWESRIE